MKLFSQAERPELLERRDELGATWPEFMHHDAVASVFWSRQYEEYPDLQLYLLDDEDRLLAESNAVAIPFGPGELPDDGWDAALERAFAGEPAKAVSAIAIVIGVDQRGRGLSTVMLDGMRKAVAARGLSDLVAPVRPSQKHLYPLTPIDRYVEWRRDDGKLFDAWLRTHEQAGARAGPGRTARHAHLRHRRRLGVLDGNALPGHRPLHRPRCARPRRDRPRAGRGRLRRAERLDAPQGLGGQADEVSVVLDEPVAHESVHGVAVERFERRRLLGDESQQRSPSLPERALEPGLLAQRLVTATA